MELKMDWNQILILYFCLFLLNLMSLTNNKQK